MKDDPLEDFQSHLNAMRTLIAYFSTMAATFPYVLTLLTTEQRKAIYQPCVIPWMHYCETLYEDPELYKNPPEIIPVDPHCPPNQLSDQIRERRGKNHPFFDFINAPFTQPIGTQISLVSVNYCWDAYDTFVKKPSVLFVKRTLVMRLSNYFKLNEAKPDLYQQPVNCASLTSPSRMNKY